MISLFFSPLAGGTQACVPRGGAGGGRKGMHCASTAVNSTYKKVSKAPRGELAALDRRKKPSLLTNEDFKARD